MFATLGDTPAQRQAWVSAAQHMHAAVMQVDGGVVGGITPDGDGAIFAFRLKDADAFRSEIVAAAAQICGSDLAQVQVTQAADRIDWVATPSAQRLREIAEVTGSSPEATEAMLAKASAPLRAGIAFSGHEARLTITRGDKMSDAAASAKGQGTDLRGRLVQAGWGTADWFATMDLRGPLRRTLMSLIEEGERTGATKLTPEARAQVDKLDKGEPVLVRARQAVMGGTARLSMELDVAQVRALVQQFEALGKALPKGKRGDTDDDDDDDDKGGRGVDDGT